MPLKAFVLMPFAPEFEDIYSMFIVGTLKEAGYEVKVGKFPFTASGKATAAGAKEGFVKVIFDAKYGEWLGAHMIGYNVTELIAEAVIARKLETTSHKNPILLLPNPQEAEEGVIPIPTGRKMHSRMDQVVNIGMETIEVM